MLSSQIRQLFLDYFTQRGHSLVPSSNLVPQDDPSLLFTNAGMVPFKEVFIGGSRRDYTKAVSCQRCIRAGGKHNDLEEVGFTRRHHTLFEMLGNFSFGDYFKQDAIAFAWEFVTKSLNLPLNRLYFSVYKDDDEAFELWKKLGVSESRIYRFGEKDNFWSMGDTGPCGPCSEIFFDLGEGAGTGPEDVMGGSGDRFLEFWNLVFMQYETRADGTRVTLPKPSIDTGMGLERISAILQGKLTNYDTDLFAPMIDSVRSQIQNTKFNLDQQKTAAQVISDHTRAATFLIADGVLPSNLGRGYVLRRILRRAIRFSYQLGIERPLLCTLAPIVMQNLGEAHPIFAGREQFVMDTMRREEESFLRTVHTGLELLDKECLQAQAKGEKSLAAAPVFLLYDTFGFPRDLTSVVLKEKGMSFDEAGFDTLMEGQRQRARKAQKFSSSMKWETKEYIEQSEGLFVGYEQLSCEAKVARVSQSAETELIKVVLDKTPFYAESGGQVGDRGHLKQEGCTLLVIDTQKEEGQIVHTCEILEGHLNPEMPVMAIVDSILRDRTRRNHTAVHLLQGILREKLGEHIQQAGSLVDAERFRFDFSHPVALTPEEISEIESELFQRINSGKKLLVHNKPLDEARKMGALCPFGEKYSDIVRVIEVPGFSMEFCGGTHVSDISEIGMVKITSESSISAGVRRIEGIVASAAFDLFQKEHEAFEGIKQSLKVKDGILDRVIGLQEELRQKEKEILKLKTEISQGSLNRMYEDVLVINGVKVLCAGFLELDAKVFKTLPDQAVQKLGSSILVFGNQSEGKASLLCRVSEDLVKSGYDAQKILAPLAEIVGGRGGGRPNLAQAGGNLPQKMDMALTEAKKLVTGILSQ